MACRETFQSWNVLILDFHFHLSIALQIHWYRFRARNSYIQINQNSSKRENSLSCYNFIKGKGLTNDICNGQKDVTTPTMVWDTSEADPNWSNCRLGVFTLSRRTREMEQFFLILRERALTTVESLSSFELNLKMKCPFSVREVRQGLERRHEDWTHCSNRSRDCLLPGKRPIAKITIRNHPLWNYDR